MMKGEIPSYIVEEQSNKYFEIPNEGREIALSKAIEATRSLYIFLNYPSTQLGSSFYGKSRVVNLTGITCFEIHKDEYCYLASFAWDNNKLPCGLRDFTINLKEHRMLGGIRSFQKGVGVAKFIEEAALELAGRIANQYKFNLEWKIEDHNLVNLQKIRGYTEDNPNSSDAENILNKKTRERKRWENLYGPDGYFKDSYIPSDEPDERFPGSISIKSINEPLDEIRQLEIVPGSNRSETRLITSSQKNITSKEQAIATIEQIQTNLMNLANNS